MNDLQRLQTNLTNTQAAFDAASAAYEQAEDVFDLESDTPSLRSVLRAEREDAATDLAIARGAMREYLNAHPELDPESQNVGGD